MVGIALEGHESIERVGPISATGLRLVVRWHVMDAFSNEKHLHRARIGHKSQACESALFLSYARLDSTRLVTHEAAVSLPFSVWANARWKGLLGEVFVWE